MIRYALAVGGLLACAHNAAATPVTWTFFETGSTFCGVFKPCPPTNFPVPLVALRLDSETSSGRSQYFAPPTGSFHINTGDDFLLTFPLTGGLLASPTAPADGQTMCCTRPTEISDFDISWNEIGGELRSVFVSLNAAEYNSRIEMSRFEIATDAPNFGGCASINNSCEGPGFWQSDLPATVPEPSTAALLLTAVLGFFGLVSGPYLLRAGQNADSASSAPIRNAVGSGLVSRTT